MARRGRPANTQAQSMNPVVPNSQTATLLLNAEDVNPPDMNVDKQTKKARTTTLVVRRSRRLNSPTRVESLEPIVQEIIVPEIEKDEVVNRENNLPDGTKDTPTTQVKTRMPNLNYKTMYIHSHKKVKSLVKKNKRLRKALKFALGKIEGYAEMTPIISSLSKANEILCNRPWSTRRLRS